MHQSDDRLPRPSQKGLLHGDTLDGLAVCASAVCMIHCLALPLLLAALPMLTAWLDPGESFHRIILAFAIPTSALALIGGWRVHHALGPVLSGVIGLALMTTGIVFAGRPSVETALSVTGSLMLAFAHVANWKQRLAPRVATG